MRQVSQGPRENSCNEPWRDFEITVTGLLSLSGYQVTGEQIIGPKKVDVVAQKQELGKTRSYGVECKDHKARIGVKVLRDIESDYRDLCDAGLIDAILIVTRNGLTPAAQTKIEKSRILYHQTIHELRLTLMDLRGYLTDIISRYVDEGLHRYYIPARFQGSEPNGLPKELYIPRRFRRTESNGSPKDLYSAIHHWLKDPDALQIALLGSYGRLPASILCIPRNGF